MPVYHPIRRWPQPARNRVLERLLDLRDLLKSEVGRHRADDTLLLATWNLRNFDSDRFGHGHRLPESLRIAGEDTDPLGRHGAVGYSDSAGMGGTSSAGSMRTVKRFIRQSR